VRFVIVARRNVSDADIMLAQGNNHAKPHPRDLPNNVVQARSLIFPAHQT
jgi:hypothetical protein